VPKTQRVSLRIRDSEVRLVDEDGTETPSSFSQLSNVSTLRSRSKKLRVLAFSDYRTQDIGKLVGHVASRKPDLILYGGDDLARFHSAGENLFEKLAGHSKYGLCAVAGNDDRNGHSYITGKDVYAVHRNALIIGSFAVVGLEGAPWFPPGSGERMNIGRL